MAQPGLVLEDLASLREILQRRDPDLVPSVERPDALAASPERERVRRAVVDELCELPEGTSDRRALELQELLIRLREPQPR